MNTLQQQARKKYLDYLKLFPNFKPKNLSAYTTIAMTLVTVSFFLIFAIKPTIATIIDLKKQITDSSYLYSQLQTKVHALSLLQGQYNSMPSDIHMILTDIPATPDVANFLGILQAIGSQTNVQITTVQTSPIGLTKQDLLKKPATSITYTLAVSGPYTNISAFLSSLATMQRMVTIDSLSLTKEDNSQVTANIQGKAYYKTLP